MVTKAKAAFLDRDGVINKNIIINGAPCPPEESEQVEILDGVVEAIVLLKAHGYTSIVITNQPDVARGKTTLREVTKINIKIKELTKIDNFYVCVHDDVHNCECRKPKPGLIMRATKDLNIDLKSSFLIGDRWRDIQAGQNCGLNSYFIDHNYMESPPVQPFKRVKSLLEAVELELGINRDE